jgi:hypothetical protein
MLSDSKFIGLEHEMHRASMLLHLVTFELNRRTTKA